MYPHTHLNAEIVHFVIKVVTLNHSILEKDFISGGGALCVQQLLRQGPKYLGQRLSKVINHNAINETGFGIFQRKSFYNIGLIRLLNPIVYSTALKHVPLYR
jgi:hypothetical protein